MEKEDYLNRNYDVDRLFNIATNLSKQKANTSFAIDGEWGAGKSFLLDMFEDKLKECQSEETNSDMFAVFHYNCWKYDYYEEPLVAIVSMMINEIEKNEKLLTEKQKKKTLAILKGVGTVALSCFNKTIESKTNIDINALLENIRAIEEGTAETLASIRDFDPFWSFNQALESMRKSLKEIAKDRTIVFVVDELDRCLPQYAIKVLERLHHITEGIDNFITIIAIDKERLLYSVADAFGYKEKEDSEKYLEKFIRHYFPLDVGQVTADVEEKYQTYINMFDESLYDCKEKFFVYFSNLFNEINMREQEQLMEKTELAHCIVADPSKHYDYTVMYMELLITVFCGYYKIDGYSLAENLKTPSLTSELHNISYFCSRFENLKFDIDESNPEDKKIKNDFYQVLMWYATFFNYITNKNHLSRDTSNVKGIDMEANSELLHSFYLKIANL